MPSEGFPRCIFPAGRPVACFRMAWPVISWNFASQAGGAPSESLPLKQSLTCPGGDRCGWLRCGLRRWCAHQVRAGLQVVSHHKKGCRDPVLFQGVQDQPEYCVFLVTGVKGEMKRTFHRSSGRREALYCVSLVGGGIGCRRLALHLEAGPPSALAARRGQPPPPFVLLQKRPGCGCQRRSRIKGNRVIFLKFMKLSPSYTDLFLLGHMTGSVGKCRETNKINRKNVVR